MPQVVPPPKSDHSTWELEKATLETPSEDPVRACRAVRKDGNTASNLGLLLNVLSPWETLAL